MKRTPVLAVGALVPDHMSRPAASPVGATTVLIRQVVPEDPAAIREFVCGLTARSQYFRFFAAAAPPSSGLLRALSGGTGADVLLAVDADGTVIGHGMAADEPGRSGSAQATNIGLVVADSWQQHGLGTLLLSTLVSRAAGRGVESLVLDVLPANTRMLGIIDRRWPDAPRERTQDATIVRPVIARWQAAAAWHVPMAVAVRSRPADTGNARA
jgi:acetyltransferase